MCVCVCHWNLQHIKGMTKIFDSRQFWDTMYVHYDGPLFKPFSQIFLLMLSDASPSGSFLMLFDALISNILSVFF